MAGTQLGGNGSFAAVVNKTHTARNALVTQPLDQESKVTDATDVQKRSTIALSFGTVHIYCSSHPQTCDLN